MPYCDKASLADYLASFAGDDPVKAVVCPFVDGGGGIPGPVLSLIVFGVVGLTISYRVRHPGPIVVAGILTGGVAALSVPGQAMKLFVLAMFGGISILGLYIYQRAQSSL